MNRAPVVSMDVAALVESRPRRAPAPRPRLVIPPEAQHPGIDPAPEPDHTFERAGE